MKRAGRATTTAAVGFLTLDALLLGYAGFARQQPWLLVAAGGCLAGAVLVILGWRRYQRAMGELEVQRREMKREVEEIRDLLFRKHVSN
jgi:hypothetical protein